MCGDVQPVFHPGCSRAGPGGGGEEMGGHNTAKTLAVGHPVCLQTHVAAATRPGRIKHHLLVGRWK